MARFGNQDDFPKMDRDKFIEMLGKAVDAANKRQEVDAPKIVSGQRPSAPDYGLSESNPICSSSLSGTEAYLSRLCTKDGRKFTWNGYSSLRTDCNGVENVGIDKYDLLIDGEYYTSVFFAPYTGESKYPPAGLSFLQNREEENEKEFPTSLEERKDDAYEEEREPELVPDPPIALPGSENTEQVADNTLRCKKCGKILPPDSLFCQYCGERFAPHPVINTIPANGEDQSIPEQKVTKKKPSSLTVIFLGSLALIVLLAVSSYVTYRMAYSAAVDVWFSRAERVNIFPAITNLYDKKLNDYIEAGNLLLEGDYSTSKKMFSELEPYLDSDKLKLEADYRSVDNLITQKAYSQALRTLTELSKKGYSDSSSKLASLQELVYKEATAQYDRGNERDKGAYYYSAETLFKMITGYRDTDKYIILIDAKSAAEGIPSFGFSGYLTNKQFNDLISIIDFLDAKEIIMMCSDGATMFLEGTWKTSDNRYHFTMDEEHTVNHNLPSTDLPNSYYAIENGMYFLYGKDKDYYSLSDFEKQKEARFLIEIVNLNTIKVYCYKDGSSYTLYRQ